MGVNSPSKSKNPLVNAADVIWQLTHTHRHTETHFEKRRERQHRQAAGREEQRKAEGHGKSDR